MVKVMVMVPRFVKFLKSSTHKTIEMRHGISNNVVCTSSIASDQPAHACSLIKAFASHLNIL